MYFQPEVPDLTEGRYGTPQKYHQLPPGLNWLFEFEGQSAQEIFYFEGCLKSLPVTDDSLGTCQDCFSFFKIKI